jgi:hypothetical protein
MDFKTWLLTFVDEKGLNTDFVFEVEGSGWGTNFIPLNSVIDYILLNSDAETKSNIKGIIVRLDFLNMDVMPYFKQIASAMAKIHG